MLHKRHGLHRLPEFAENRVAEMQNRAKEFSEYEGNRNRAPDRRPRPRGHPQGDPPHHAYPRGRPVTDNIGTVGEILLCDGRFGQTARVEVVHSDEGTSLDRGNPGGVREKVQTAQIRCVPTGLRDFLCVNNVRKGMCCLAEQSYIESKHQTK